VLLDELEKACPDIWNVLLQVIDDGILTDGKGQTVSFKNTVIIMTSNIGSQKILDLVNEKSSPPSSRPRYSDLVRVVKTELEATMKPEFLNRIDEIVIFEPLSERELHGIATAMCLNIAARIRLEREVDIAVQPALLQKIVRDGGRAAAQFGARPMRRAVQHILENAISEAFVQGFLVEGDSASFDLLITDDFDDSFDVVEECEIDGMRSFCVTVSRSRDKSILEVHIEESCRDLVAETTLAEDVSITETNGDSMSNTAPAAIMQN
jgi:ATP-dependent Clp protease ATP-binding subunit ClpC